MASKLPHVIFLDHDCWLHQYQLMVKSQLTHCDHLCHTVLGADYNFYASLSKLMIVWREKARSIHDRWSVLFPQTAHFARRVPPKCIRGRWGAVSNCEKFAMSPPRDAVSQ